MFTAQEVALFCHQITLLLNSNVSLADGMAAMAKDSTEPKEKAVLEAVAKALDDRSTLPEALKAAGVFPEYMVGMCQLGEKSGTLDRVVAELTLFYEREERLAKSIKRAVGYPLFLISMMAVVMTVMVWKIIPIFKGVIEGFGVYQGGQAAVAVGVGQVLGIVALVLVLILLAAVVVVYRNLRKSKGVGAVRAVFGKTALGRKILKNMAVSRLTSVLHTMFLSGYQADDALDLAMEVVEDPEVAGLIKECREKLDIGISFGQSLTDTGLFSGVYARMIHVGFETGSVDQVMEKLTAIYGEEAEDGLDSLVSLIEPLLVGVLSVLIGAVLLAVMLPLVGVMMAVS